MHINFIFLSTKLSIKYKGNLLQALEYLQWEYGIVKIHSIRPKKGPLIIFRNLPGVLEVKDFCIKRGIHL